jgi:hypothetical protein
MRTVAREQLLKYPSTIFQFYRAAENQEQTDRLCNIAGFEVMNGTEMMKLPCWHRFSVRALYEWLACDRPWV